MKQARKTKAPSAAGQYDPALPIAKIHPSPTNPRKTFEELDDLAASIKAHGVLEPVLVRPMRLQVSPGRSGGRQGFLVELLDQKGKPIAFLQDGFRESAAECKALLPVYELVAGERRYRAAQLAGLDALPARILELSDLQVLEIQLIENVQRADVPPVEQAEGYARLLDNHGLTVADIAERTGRSEAWVYGTLKLRNLPPAAREAIAQGRILRNHGILIGRIPNEKLREKATERMLHPKEWAYTARPELQGEVMTFRDAKRMVEEEFMVELKGAPFDRKSLTLIPAAGSCDSCPKMTGNNREEFPEARADVCTDPECFRAKAKAHEKATAARAEEKGVKVLTGREARKALQPWGSDYEDLARHCNTDPEGRTFRQIAGEKLNGDVVAAVDEKGKLHYLAPKQRVREILVEEGVIDKDANAGHHRHTAGLNGFAERDRRKNEIDNRARQLLLRGLAEKAERWFVAGMNVSTSSAFVGICEHLARMSLDPLFDDSSIDTFVESLGFTSKEEETEEQLVARLFAGRSAAGFLSLALVAAMVRELPWTGIDSIMAGGTKLLEFLDIDLKTLKAEAKEQLEQEEKAAKAETKNAKPETNGDGHETDGVAGETPIAPLLEAAGLSEALTAKLRAAGLMTLAQVERFKAAHNTLSHVPGISARQAKRIDEVLSAAALEGAEV